MRPKWPPRAIFGTEGNLALKYLKRRNPEDVTEVFEALTATSVDAVAVHVGLSDEVSWRGSPHAELWGDNMADDCGKLFSDGDATVASALSTNSTGADLLQMCLAAMIDDGHDVFQLYIDRARQTDLGIYAFYRMNDAHCNNEPRMEDARRSAMKVSRPDLLIGSPSPYMNKHGDEWNFCWQWDFAEKEVRDRFLGLFDETLTRYDVDGLELDFTRKPPFFKPGQAFRGISTMTEFMRQAREVVHRHAARKGKEIRLVCRALSSIDCSLGLGLDIETWIREGLVDIAVISAAGGWGNETDVARAVAAAENSEVLIYSGSGGLISASPQEGYESGQPSVMRGVALNCHKEGATGIHLYNHDYASFRPQPVSAADESDMPLVEYPSQYRELTGHMATDRLTRKELQTYRDLADPKTLERLSRCYYLNERQDLGDHNRQVPRKLAIVGRGAGPGHAMHLKVEDDIAGGLAKGRIASTELRLRLSDYEQSLPRIRCEVNGEPVDLCAARKIESSSGDQWLVVDNPPIHEGENTVLVLLEGFKLPEGTPMKEPGVGGSPPWPTVHQCELLVLCNR